MHLTFVIDQLHLAGTEKQFTMLAEGLAQAGENVHMVVLARRSDSHPSLLARLAEARVRVDHIGGVQWGLPNLAIRLRRTLRKSRPDVVHAAMSQSMVLAAAVCLLERTPLVLSRRSLVSARMDSALARRVRVASTGLAELVIANSHAVALESHRIENIPNAKLRVIPNIVRMPSGEHRRGTASAAVICVANLREGKGHDVLLASLSSLASAGLPLQAILVGDGSLRHDLQESANSLGLGELVEFTGAVEEPLQALARAAVFVQPSLAEGMSNALLEAMAVGLPIVATDVGGTAEALEGCGLLIPPSDADALARALASVVTDRSLRESMGRASQERARHFSVSKSVTRHLTVYQEAIRLKHSP